MAQSLVTGAGTSFVQISATVAIPKCFFGHVTGMFVRFDGAAATIVSQIDSYAN
jgi:hypothetical protein